MNINIVIIQQSVYCQEKHYNIL